MNPSDELSLSEIAVTEFLGALSPTFEVRDRQLTEHYVGNVMERILRRE